MTHSRCFLLKLLGSVGLLASASGCSLIFVKTPPDSLADFRSSSCTSSPLAPIIDTGIGGFQVVRTVMAATADPSVYRDPKQPLSRGTDIGLGLTFTALFLGSALYGYVNVNQCANRQSGHESDGARGDEDEAPAEAGDATERWETLPFRGGRPPSARPASARQAPPARPASARQAPPARPASAHPTPPAPAPPAETKPVEPIPIELEEDPSPSPEAPPASP